MNTQIMKIPAGLFFCEGKYNSDRCCYPKDHEINPYQSAEVGKVFISKYDWWSTDLFFLRITCLSFEGSCTLFHLEPGPPGGEEQDRGASHRLRHQGLLSNHHHHRLRHQGGAFNSDLITNFTKGHQDKQAKDQHRLFLQSALYKVCVVGLGTVDNRMKNNQSITLYYNSRLNLKLVHIVCHDKGSHKGMVCDREMFYK